MDPQYPDFGEPFGLVPWVDHIYDSLRWTEESVRQLHRLLEHETVDDELRGKVAKTIAWLDTARDEAQHALEKMGPPRADAAKARQYLSSVADETKAKVLELTATLLEAMLGSPEAERSHAALVGSVRDVVHELKTQAAAIAGRKKAIMDGPP